VRKGWSSDNAASEGIFGRGKNEMCYGRNWASTTQEEFICVQVSLGAMSPVSTGSIWGSQHNQSNKTSASPNTTLSLCADNFDAHIVYYVK